MEPTALADQTVAFMAPYLAAAGKGVARRVGEALWDQFRGAAAKLLRCVKEKFSTNPEAAANLSRLEEDPASRARQAIVREQLARFIQGDQGFGRELEMLVNATRRSGGDAIIQTVNVSQGTVGDITQIGKINGG